MISSLKLETLSLSPGVKTPPYNFRLKRGSEVALANEMAEALKTKMPTKYGWVCWFTSEGKPYYSSFGSNNPFSKEDAQKEMSQRFANAFPEKKIDGDIHAIYVLKTRQAEVVEEHCDSCVL